MIELSSRRPALSFVFFRSMLSLVISQGLCRLGTFSWTEFGIQDGDIR